MCGVWGDRKGLLRLCRRGRFQPTIDEGNLEKEELALAHSLRAQLIMGETGIVTGHLVSAFR